MASPLVGTVIITGGNGALGSAIAVAIAKKQPLAHLLLAVRDTSAESVQQVIEKIRGSGPDPSRLRGSTSLGLLP